MRKNIFEMCHVFQLSMVDGHRKNDSEPRSFCVERKLMINLRRESVLVVFLFICS